MNESHDFINSVVGTLCFKRSDQRLFARDLLKGLELTGEFLAFSEVKMAVGNENEYKDEEMAEDTVKTTFLNPIYT